MHLTCSGKCILRVWQHGSALQPCKCPLCRRSVTLLVPNDASTRRRHDPDVAETLQKIEMYNRSFGGGTTSLIQVQFVFKWSFLFVLAKCNSQHVILSSKRREKEKNEKGDISICRYL